MTQHTELACTCGQVHIQLEHDPILSVECHCTSCRTAGERLQALPDAPSVLNANGGTPYVLYRKDRVRFTSGRALMKEFRLQPDSPTRRIVATCCNTPIFLEFQHGHWLSIYAGLWPEKARPPLEMRTMVSDVPEGVVLDTSVPNLNHQNLSFFARLLGAWIAMGFRTPKVEVEGTLDA